MIWRYSTSISFGCSVSHRPTGPKWLKKTVKHVMGATSPQISHPVAGLKVKAEPEDAKVWPADTNLVLPVNRGKIQVTAQTDRVRAVVSQSFNHLQIVFTFDDAFPERNLQTPVFRRCLIDGAHEVDADIKSRLKRDHQYATHMVSLVRQYFPSLSNAHLSHQVKTRLTSYRGVLKTKTMGFTIGAFALKPDCDDDYIDWLLDHNTLPYIYPVDDVGRVSHNLFPYSFMSN